MEASPGANPYERADDASRDGSESDNFRKHVCPTGAYADPPYVYQPPLRRLCDGVVSALVQCVDCVGPVLRRVVCVDCGRPYWQGTYHRVRHSGRHSRMAME